MSLLKQKLEALIPKLRAERKGLLEKHGEAVVDQVKVEQVFGGMRSIMAMICDTSEVSPSDGLIVRGIPIARLTKRLPEELFWLLVTGKLPDPRELAELQQELNKRAELPAHVKALIDSMPAHTHPMTLLSAGVLALQTESVFAKAYAAGIPKQDYWMPVLEDALNLMAWISPLAAYIYFKKYRNVADFKIVRDFDWGKNFARMLQLQQKSDEADNMMRLYLTLHCDHEGGNVSAFTSHVVASALSDAFYTVSAGLNGLAGPLHGLANQECLRFWLGMQSALGDKPSDKAITTYIWDKLNSKQVIPGYGHAVLRSTDPRFTALYAFGKKEFSNDPVFHLVDRGYALIPGILKEQGKVKSPFPNVDAGSGAVLWHFGLREFDFNTVFFGVSRCMGLLAQMIVSRAVGEPITRPKSVTTDWVKQQVEKSFVGQMQANMVDAPAADLGNQVWTQHGFVETRPFVV